MTTPGRLNGAAPDAEYHAFAAEVLAGVDDVPIDSAKRVGYLVRLLVELQARRDRIPILAQSMERDVDADLRAVARRYAGVLEAHREAYRRKDRKSVKTLDGMIGRRTAPGGIRLLDREAATDWARCQSEPLAFGRLVYFVDEEDLVRYRELTGEEIPGLEVVADVEVLYVKGEGPQVNLTALAEETLPPACPSGPTPR